MLTSVTSVGDDFCKTRKLKPHGLKYLRCAYAVMDIGLMDYYSKGDAQCVNYQVLFPAFDFLVAVDASATVNMVRRFDASGINQT